MNNTTWTLQNADYESDLSSAKKILDDLIQRLPDDLRPEALRISYELRPFDRDSVGECTLGDYSRSGQCIRIFVQTIRDYCMEESLPFSEQVEKTYLHELGHHLGLSEDDVSKRGL